MWKCISRIREIYYIFSKYPYFYLEYSFSRTLVAMTRECFQMWIWYFLTYAHVRPQMLETFLYKTKNVCNFNYPTDYLTVYDVMCYNIAFMDASKLFFFFFFSFLKNLVKILSKYGSFINRLSLTFQLGSYLFCFFIFVPFLYFHKTYYKFFVFQPDGDQQFLLYNSVR